MMSPPSRSIMCIARRDCSPQSQRSKDVFGKALGVDTDECGLLWIDLAPGEHQVLLAGCGIGMAGDLDRAGVGRQLDRLGDRADDVEAMARGTRLELRHTSHVPIVAMTANAMSGDRENCIAAGMDDYVAKPVTRSTISEVIDRWLVLNAQAQVGTTAS